MNRFASINHFILKTDNEVANVNNIEIKYSSRFLIGLTFLIKTNKNKLKFIGLKKIDEHARLGC